MTSSRLLLLRFIFLTSISGMFFSVTDARADIYFKPAAMYLIDGNESGGTKTTTTRVLVDLGFGYVADGGLLVGGTYAIEQGKVKTEGSSGAGTQTDSARTSMGVGVGWSTTKDTGPYVMGTYFFSSDYTSSVIYPGTGMQLDLGMRFAIKKAFLGIQLSYKQFEYKKYRSGSIETDLSSPLRHTFLDPYFALILQF